jgi:hypothetical protein
MGKAPRESEKRDRVERGYLSPRRRQVKPSLSTRPGWSTPPGPSQAPLEGLDGAGVLIVDTEAASQ